MLAVVVVVEPVQGAKPTLLFQGALILCSQPKRTAQAYQKIFGSGAPKVKATPEAELIAQKEKEAKDAPPPPAAEKKAGAWDPSSLGR
jgi:hypothetical protein